MKLRGVLLVGPLLLAGPLIRSATAEPSPLSIAASVAAPAAALFGADDPTLASVAPPMSREPADRANRAREVEFPASLPDLGTVHWTTTQKLSMEDVAGRWGLRAKELRQLNPKLRRNKKVPAGTELVVFHRSEKKPPLSLGAPNKGRLRRGVPLPEGDVWRLRKRRARSYGSQHTIEALMMAMHAFGHAFPDAEPVRLGDISVRTGGRLSPHLSHRTGRDIDIGYVLKEGTRGERYWQSADEKNFDVEKNWFLLKALIETGRVQRVFLSGRLSRLIMERAKSELTRAQLQHYFRAANPDPQTVSIIRHWRGHRDHMHIRFTCEPENRACISRSK